MKAAELNMAIELITLLGASLDLQAAKVRYPHSRHGKYVKKYKADPESQSIGRLVEPDPLVVDGDLATILQSLPLLLPTIIAPIMYLHNSGWCIRIRWKCDAKRT